MAYQISSDDDEIADLIEVGRFAEALPLAQKRFDYHQRCTGGQHDDDTEDVYVDLIFCLVELKRYEEAERLNIELLTVTQRAMGPEDPATLRCCGILAITWQRMGKLTEADGMHRRVVEFSTRVLGEQHWQAILDIRSHGEFLVDHMGQEEEGVRLLHKALELNIRLNGLEHEYTIQNMLVLGRAHTAEAVCDLAKAEKMLRRAMELSQRVIGLGDPVTLNIMLELRSVLFKLERWEQMLPLCRKLLKAHRKRGPACRDTPMSTRTLAIVLTELGRYDEAHPLAMEALEGYIRVWGHEDPEVQVCAKEMLEITLRSAVLNRGISRDEVISQLARELRRAEAAGELEEDASEGDTSESDTSENESESDTSESEGNTSESDA